MTEKEILKSIARKQILSHKRTKLIRELGRIETEISLIDNGFVHDDDFTFIIYKENDYNFTPIQGQAIKAMLEKEEAGISSEELSEKIKSKQSYIFEIFKGSQWKEIIEKNKSGPFKGNYKLKVFSDTPKKTPKK